ncbi:MAG TPA: UDP-N-acetylglucosamine 2-epimerase (non-hydrolyzing) [Solirubrobacterales bacterium]|nr:UDP-N-acetylglucosamine 2-epimerase (non-hydrolyzing) [Solirubrobacterales bacterium]
MKVLTVVGNRPQFVKAAAVSPLLRRHATEVLVHTGQHYDRELSAVFFEELELPPPERQLAVGSGSHAVQTGTTLIDLEQVVAEERPDAVLVYGDTNATVAGALVAAKAALPLAHVEAGMRSFNRAMPEEVNRLVVDRVAGLHLCPTEAAVANLRAIGLGEGARLVGDPMADVALRVGPLAEQRSQVLERLGLTRGDYLLATAHRAGNVDELRRLARLATLLRRAAVERGPLVFVVHPRTEARLRAADLLSELRACPDLRLCQPLGYLDFTCLVRGARAVLTDSGGLQKEAYLAGAPCLTLREETEWVETVESGWNRLVGLDPAHTLDELATLESRRQHERPDPALYGSGEAGQRCVRELLAWAGAGSTS